MKNFILGSIDFLVLAFLTCLILTKTGMIVKPILMWIVIVLSAMAAIDLIALMFIGLHIAIWGCDDLF